MSEREEGAGSKLPANEPVLLPSGWMSNQYCFFSLSPHTCTVKELKERASSRYNLVRVSMCHQHAAPAQDSSQPITETPVTWTSLPSSSSSVFLFHKVILGCCLS